MKKITLLLICLVSVLNSSATVYSGSCGDNVRYSLDTETGVLSITGSGAMKSYSSSSYVPWYYNTSYIKTVMIATGITSIGDYAFYNCPGLTSVTIPNSVTSIERYAFGHCTGLKSVIFPYRMTSIGINAFRDCTGLVSLTIPNSVTTIWDNAFDGCSRLTSVTIPNSVTYIGSSAFNSCYDLTSVNITDIAAWCKISFNGSSSNPVYYAHHLFMGGKEVTDVIIPNSVKSIKNWTFIGCYGLKSITIPTSVTSIGASAFSVCSSLTSVTIPNSVTTIGDNAFNNCYFEKQNFINNSSLDAEANNYWGAAIVDSRENGFVVKDGVLLKYIGNENSVTIPNSVTSIGEGVFRNTNLITLIVGSGVQSIASNALSTKPIKTIWLTNTPPQNYTVAQGTVNYVANSLYNNLSNKIEYKFLSSMFEVDGVRYVPVSPSERTCDAIDCIYGEAFTDININSMVSYKGVSMKVQNVQPYTFYQNNHLQKINFGIAGNIGKYVCYGCKNLQTAVLGENVTGIGESAFNGCSKLDGITVPESVDTIGQYAFSNCSGIISVNIGAGPNTIGDYVFSGCSSLSSVNIGVGTNTIGNYVFSGCTNLESISLGEGTVTIGNCVFSDCSKLSSITVPSSMNSIGNYAFRGCTSLKTIIIANRQSEGDLKFGYNGSNPLFVDCPLDSVYIGRNISYSTSSSYGYSPFYRNTSLRSVTVTDKETEISDNEFYGCTNLQNVQIGDGVTSIGNWAFSGCSSLKNFSFGTQVQTIGKEAFSDCNAVTAITSKAENPPVCGSMALDDINKWECKLYVPEGHVADYQAAVQWKEFLFVEEGEEGSSTPVDPSGNKCATPTIEYVDGKLTFDCETDGVEFVYNIVPQSSLSGKGEDVNLPSEYRVTVYAIKGGYEDSDVATKEINISGLGGIRGDVNFDNEVGMPDVMFIVNYILNGKFPDEE